MLTTWQPRDEVRDNENRDTSSDDVTSLEDEQDRFISVHIYSIIFGSYAYEQ